MTGQVSVGGAPESHPGEFVMNSNRVIPTSPFPGLLALSVSLVKHWY